MGGFKRYDQNKLETKNGKICEGWGRFNEQQRLNRVGALKLPTPKNYSDRNWLNYSDRNWSFYFTTNNNFS